MLGCERHRKFNQIVYLHPSRSAHNIRTDAAPGDEPVSAASPFLALMGLSRGGFLIGKHELQSRPTLVKKALNDSTAILQVQTFGNGDKQGFFMHKKSTKTYRPGRNPGCCGLVNRTQKSHLIPGLGFNP